MLLTFFRGKRNYFLFIVGILIVHLYLVYLQDNKDMQRSDDRQGQAFCMITYFQLQRNCRLPMKGQLKEITGTCQLSQPTYFSNNLCGPPKLTTIFSAMKLFVVPTSIRTEDFLFMFVEPKKERDNQMDLSALGRAVYEESQIWGSGVIWTFTYMMICTSSDAALTSWFKIKNFRGTSQD